MARTQKFPSEQMLAATRDLAVKLGPAEVTIAKIAAALGAPTGSIYHRFASRDELLGQVWLNTADRYQRDYHAALREGPPIEAALASVRFVLDRARAQPDEARLLLLHRRQDFLAPSWPGPMQAAAKRLEDDARRHFLAFARRVLPGDPPSPDAIAGLRYALIDLPLAAIIPALRRGKALDEGSDAWVFAAVRAVLHELGVEAPSPRKSTRQRPGDRRRDTLTPRASPPRSRGR